MKRGDCASGKEGERERERGMHMTEEGKENNW